MREQEARLQFGKIQFVQDFLHTRFGVRANLSRLAGNSSFFIECSQPTSSVTVT